MFHNVAMEMAKDVQNELSSKTAIVQGEAESLQKIPYTTEIVEENGEIAVVPTFDNSVDEYSNSLFISKYGFEGSLTLTKVINKLTQ